MDAPRPTSDRCGSLYPGGHGEERECVLPAGHAGAHDYAVVMDAPRPTRTCEECGEDISEKKATARYCSRRCKDNAYWRGAIALPLVLDPATVARFFALVDLRGEDECWMWLGSSVGSDGYGRFYANRKPVYAHRFAYEAKVGPIPDGYEVDHLCRTTGCVNPKHLEAVPPLVNLARNDSPASVNARKTHCKRGHEFTPDNTIRDKYGRHCRRCKAEQRAAK